MLRSWDFLEPHDIPKCFLWLTKLESNNETNGSTEANKTYRHTPNQTPQKTHEKHEKLGDMVKQGFYGQKCLTRVFQKSVCPLECLPTVSFTSKGMLQECSTSVSHKSMWQECPMKVFWRECFARVSRRSCTASFAPFRSWHLGPHLSCCMNEYPAHFGIPMNTFSTFLKPYIWSVVSNIFYFSISYMG